MSDFSTKQVRALKQRLNRAHVQSREVDGKSIDYIEGWFAISEANAIFGLSGWDREMTHFERVFEWGHGDSISCGYLARVRVRVRAGDAVATREGTGWGSAKARSPGEAHERALKAAETDATKRALATFGNRFGLSLYDKEQQGVTAKVAPTVEGWTIYDPSGAPFAENLSYHTFCSGLRQLIAKTQDPSELAALERYNKAGIARLRHEAPKLKTAKGEHYADILERLFQAPHENSRKLGSRFKITDTSISLVLAPSRIAPGPRIDKSRLAIGAERRLRDKAHLRKVASSPCLVCGKQPSHAHHLTFAQPRGLSLKVSDEFTVPLCALHHGELHRSGQERGWWREHQLDPLAVANKLWQDNQARTSEIPKGKDDTVNP